MIEKKITTATATATWKKTNTPQQNTAKLDLLCSKTSPNAQTNKNIHIATVNEI